VAGIPTPWCGVSQRTQTPCWRSGTVSLSMQPASPRAWKSAVRSSTMTTPAVRSSRAAVWLTAFPASLHPIRCIRAPGPVGSVCPWTNGGLPSSRIPAVIRSLGEGFGQGLGKPGRDRARGSWERPLSRRRRCVSEMWSFLVRRVPAEGSKERQSPSGASVQVSRAVRLRPVAFARYRAESAEAIIVLRSAVPELLDAMP
jgi:hypothetical protein